MRIGYVRVSTGDQSLDLQRDALRAAGCERIYGEIASEARVDRPEFARALEALRPGDALVVWRLDRLGRSLRELVTLVDAIASRGAGLVLCREGRLSVVEIARTLGIGKATLYRYLRHRGVAIGGRA